MPQSFGLLAELPGFVGPAAVLAHLLQSLRDVNPVPDTGDAVTAARVAWLRAVLLPANRAGGQVTMNYAARCPQDMRPGVRVSCGHLTIGRMEIIELWPFSQGELERSPDAFPDAAFAHGPGLSRTSTMRKRDYLDRVVRGGYPEAIRRSPRRRAAFFDSYLTSLIERHPGNP